MQDRPTPSSRMSIVARVALLLAALGLVLPSTPTMAAAAEPTVAAPEIVPFGQWAPAACRQPTGADPTPVRRLVVHHTHEPVAHTPAEVRSTLALACQAHADRGFDTIGYHYVVDPWGGVWQGRGGLPGEDGRAPSTQAQGAHVAGSNPGAVGVAFLGDHAEEPPTAAALGAATQLLAWLVQDTGIDPGALVTAESSGVGTARFTGEFHPRAVTGHSASNHTDCPGEHLRALLGEIRDRMREHLAGVPVTSWDGLAAVAPAVPAPDAGSTAEASLVDTATVEAAPPVASRRLPTVLAPLLSPVGHVAGTLRTMGLLSLAERLGPGRSG